MKEFPDDELDKLFRKSSEELDSTFDPDDWNALKRKLDEHDGKTPSALFKKWWPTGLLALLFVAGLTTYVLKRDGETENINVSRTPVKSQISGKTERIHSDKLGKDAKKAVESESASDTKSVVKNGVSDSIAENTDSKTGEPKIDITTDKSAQKELVSKAENKKILPRRWSKTGGVYLEPDRSIGRRVDGAFYSKNKTSESLQSEKGSSLKEEKTEFSEEKSNVATHLGNVDNQLRGENKLPVSSTTGDQNNSVLTTDLDSEAGQNRLLIDADLLKSRSLIPSKSNKLPEIEKTETPQIIEPIKQAEENTSPKFAVRFGFSPDISSVGLKNFTKPGTAVSLLIEYSFLPKLYFQTGLIRSSKGYNAKPGEYEWPSSWNDQKARPISVDAICKVIEVPLNLRYDISQNDRSRWFVGAGASSYYMQDEKYEYNYAPHTYNIIWYEKEAATGWYWLSHLNASAGYEYRFSKKLSLLAEPYVRIPIKKVGYGKVNLFSTGVWFSIRYTPNFK